MRLACPLRLVAPAMIALESLQVVVVLDGLAFPFVLHELKHLPGIISMLDGNILLVGGLNPVLFRHKVGPLRVHLRAILLLREIAGGLTAEVVVWLLYFCGEWLSYVVAGWVFSPGVGEERDSFFAFSARFVSSTEG